MRAPYETYSDITVQFGLNQHTLSVIHIVKRSIKGDFCTAQVVLLHDSSPIAIYIVEVSILFAILTSYG